MLLELLFSASEDMKPDEVPYCLGSALVYSLPYEFIQPFYYVGWYSDVDQF